MSKKDDDLLAEATARHALCCDAERSNMTQGRDDLKFLSGDHWPDDAKRLREAERRPCITVNKLPAFIHQVTNDQRQNKPGISVHPVDDFADPETAQVLQGMVRHIEYASNADFAYDTAGNSAAAIGFGYFRILTEYEDESSFDQVCRFERLRNAFAVHIDPGSKEPDGSDQRFSFVDGTMARAELRRDYPDAQAASAHARDDVDTDDVIVSEYYRIEESPEKLVLLQDGTAAWEDEIPEGAVPVNSRKSYRRKVCWYKLAGTDIVPRGEATRPGQAITFTDVLESAEIPCRWIPVFPVYGDELDIDGKVIRSGLVRHAKDPSLMYDYWMTAATEEVSMRPKTPYIGAEGQFEGHEQKWAQANVRTFAYLEYKPKSVGGQAAPPPQRQPMADVPVGVLSMAAHAADEIKATTGLFDSSLGARGNATSGIQEREQKRQGNVANFHFSDNLNRAVRHAGRCLVDMIPRIYDTPRTVRILGEDESVSHAKINQHMLPDNEPSDRAKGVKRALNDLSVGKYDVTVSSGPSYSTLRQEAAESMVSFGQSWPKLMDIAGDKVVKAMDWPGAEDIAERIKKTIPQELLGDDDKDADAQPKLPPEVQQFVAQAQAHIQQLEQALQEAKSGIDKERIKAQSAENVARINSESRQDVEEIKGWIAMMIQHMQPPPQLGEAVYEDEAQNTAQPAGQPTEPAQIGQ